VPKLPETAAVYQFTWWDRLGKEIVSSRFATLEAITRCNGKAIEASRLVVNSREVDRNGFHSVPQG
jgi:hypothetical protein